MARNLGLDGGVDVASRIRFQGAQLFFAHGYGSATIRELAEAVGISSSTLYHHYRNKQDILFAIIHTFMIDFNAEILPVLDDISRPPWDRLESAIRLHLSISSDRHTELLTGHSNRSALTSEQLRAVVALQLEYQIAIQSVVAELLDPTTPAVELELTTMAMMDLVNGVRQWYRSDGSMSIESIADHYVELIGAMLSRTRTMPMPMPTQPEEASAISATERVRPA